MKEQDDHVTQVVLVRHGQTEWNRVERFRGRTDIELNEAGRLQAQALAGRLRNWKINAVYASPLKRALQTAQPIADSCGIEVQRADGLVDVDYGAWTGQSPLEVARRFGDLYRTWLETPHLVQFPDGESLDDVRIRAWDAVEHICSHHEGQTVVLVSHLVVNRVLICAVLGLSNSSFWQVGQDNAAVNVIAVQEGKCYASSLNDTCHLDSFRASRPEIHARPRCIET